MRWTRVLHLVLLLMLPAAVAIAQPPPPPPLNPLPPPPQPPGNLVTTAKANLGKALFWDEQVSSTRTVACGSCHQAARGGSDARTMLGSNKATNPGPDGSKGTADDILGSPGVILNQPDGTFSWSSAFGIAEQVTGRLAMSFINAAYAPEAFWDGRAGQSFSDPETGQLILQAGGALENQVLGPPVSSVEMGHIGRSWSDVATRIAGSQPLMLASHVASDLDAWIAGRDYPQLFTEAFGSPTVTGARIAMAIASYERTQFSTQAPIDSVIAGTAVLTPQENQGRQIFGAAGCAGCHAGSLFSDNQFHYTGVRPVNEDVGREGVTGNPQDLGAMRTPSLRNVAQRPAFMHDGRFTTLDEVVAFYNRGGDFDAPNKAPGVHPLGLTAQQQAALVAFMRRPLTDPRVAAGVAPFDRPTLYTESGLAPQILTGGVAGITGAPPAPVAIEPALLGNPRFTIGVSGAPGGAQAVLVIDSAEPPASGGIPASSSLARVVTTLQGSGASDGFGSATIAIPSDGSYQGRSFYGRWYVADAAASEGVASSPSFRFTVFGPHGATGVLAVEPGATGSGGRLAFGPNPFSTSTQVRFALPASSRATLKVYDLSGRAVRTLFNRTAEPGSYTIDWDGRDDAGRTVGDGVYFYRLDTNSGSSSARIVRVQ